MIFSSGIVTKRCTCCGNKVKDVNILFNIECWCGTMMYPYAMQVEKDTWLVYDIF